MSTVRLETAVTIVLSEEEAQQLRAVLGCMESGPLDDLYEQLMEQLPQSDLDADFEPDDDGDGEGWVVALVPAKERAPS